MANSRGDGDFESDRNSPKVGKVQALTSFIPDDIPLSFARRSSASANNRTKVVPYLPAQIVTY